MLTWTVSAGRATTNDELENMLESGNPAIFTQGVRGNFITLFFLVIITVIVSSSFSLPVAETNEQMERNYGNGNLLNTLYTRHSVEIVDEAVILLMAVW